MSQLVLFEAEYSIKEGDTRVCRMCGLDKNIDSFAIMNGGSFRLRYCRSCQSKQNKAREKARLNYPQPTKDHVCPICMRNEEQLREFGGKNQTVWSFDHCYETGKARGYLCHSCNRGLGLLGDSVDNLKRAMEYKHASI